MATEESREAYADMKKKAKAVECAALNGDGKAWAVVDGDGYTIYEAEFCEATAKELALLCASMPKANWERHRQVLERMGCDLRDPAEASNVEFSGTPAASSPEAPLERRVGPGAQEEA